MNLHHAKAVSVTLLILLAEEEAWFYKNKIHGLGTRGFKLLCSVCPLVRPIACLQTYKATMSLSALSKIFRSEINLLCTIRNYPNDMGITALFFAFPLKQNQFRVFGFTLRQFLRAQPAVMLRAL